MGKGHVVEHLVAYLSGDLREPELGEVTDHLSSCAECRRECEALSSMWDELGRDRDERPRPQLDRRFREMLREFEGGTMRAGGRSRGARNLVDFFRPGRPAFSVGFGAAMILVGCAVGYWLRGGGGDPGDIALLRNEVHSLKDLLTVSLLNQASASERLKGVSLGDRLQADDPEVRAALLYTMKHDGNVNVRLAALDALAREIGRPAVRSEIVHALPAQSSPLMQMALVDLLVQINDGESRDVLKEVLRKPGLHPEVKKRIEMGIRQIL